MKHQIKIGTLFYTKPHGFQLLTGDFSWGCSMENMIKVALGQFQATNGTPSTLSTNRSGDSKSDLLVPSGKRLHNYGKFHPFSMGKSTINGHFQ